MHRICVVFAAVGLLGGVTSHAQDSGWPKELQGDRADLALALLALLFNGAEAMGDE